MNFRKGFSLLFISVFISVFITAIAGCGSKPQSNSPPGAPSLADLIARAK